MTHEQMVAWLILEGWEYHPYRDNTIEHIARGLKEDKPRGGYIGEGILYEHNRPWHSNDEDVLIASKEGYRADFAGCSTKAIREFYNAANKLQENQND